MKIVNILIFVVWACLSVKSLGKYVSGRAYLKDESISEVSKFTFSPGRGIINATLEFSGVPRGSVYLFMDTNWWDKFYSAESECERLKHSHTEIEIGKTGNAINKGKGSARGGDVVDIGKGKKRWNFRWQINHQVRSYGWYMVMADCSPTVPEKPKEKQPPNHKRRKSKFRTKIEYQVEFLNDGGHLSADELWLTEIYLVVTASLTAGWFYFSRLNQSTFGSGPRHLVIYFIRTAYLLQIVSMIFEVIHQIVYRYNGSGIWVFDLFSEFVEGASQTVVSFMLLCIANGWTLSSKGVKNKYDPSITEVLNNPSLLDIDNPVLLLMVIFMFFSIILQLVNKLYDDSFLKFHDHETWAGFILLVIRFVFGILFFISLNSTVNAEKKKGAGDNFIRFLRSLMIFGSAWFLIFPVIVFVASFFAHYWRHFVVSTCVLVVQSVCLCFLSYEFGSSRSMVAKFSEVQQQGMLPGFTRGGGGNTFANKYV